MCERERGTCDMLTIYKGVACFEQIGMLNIQKS